MPVSQISIIPRLYRAYVEETRKHRFVIFGSGSSQAQEQTVQGKIREAGLKAFATCSKALHKQGDVVEVWGGVRELLEVLDEAKLVGSSVSELTDTLRDTAPWAIRALEQSSGYSCFFQLNQSLTVTHTSKGLASVTAEKADIALEILRILLRIDYNLLGPQMSDIFTVLLTVCHPLDESS